MGPLAVLDSNVILYLVNGQLADPLPVEGYLVSIISKIEVLGFKGFNSGEEQAIQSLLEQVVVVPLDEDIVTVAIELRRATSLRLPDAIIAATAIVAKAELLTHDSSLLSLPNLKASAPLLK